MSDVKSVELLINEINNVTKEILAKENETFVKTTPVLINLLTDDFTSWEFSLELNRRLQKISGDFNMCRDVEDCFIKVNSCNDDNLRFLYTFQFIVMKNRILPLDVLKLCFTKKGVTSEIRK